MINTIQNKTDIKSNSKTANPRVGFKNGFLQGATSLVTNGIKGIENGGIFAEFLFVDTFGNVIPRSYQAFNRNKEELGHLNYKAGTEETIREALSGPSMFLVPMGFNYIWDKMGNSATNIQYKTQDALTNSFKNLISQSPTVADAGEFKKEYYKNLINEAFEPHRQARPDNIAEINKGAAKIAENLALIKNPKKDKELVKEIRQTVSDLNKAHGINLDYSYNLTLKGGVTKEAGALTKDILNYSGDVVDKVAKGLKDSKNIKQDGIPFLNKLHKTKIKNRTLNLALTFVATVASIVVIPSIYTRYKKFPGVAGLTPDYPAAAPLQASSALSFKKESSDSARKNDNSPAFKGANVPGEGIFRRYDFDGVSVPRPVLAVYMLGAMYGSRMFKARDNDERREITIRDVPGLTATFAAVPVLRNASAIGLNKLTGIPTMKPVKSPLGVFSFNNKPFSFDNIGDIYSGVSKYRNGIVDWVENVSKLGGNLGKSLNVLTDKSKNALNQIVPDFAKKSNSEIIEQFRKASQNEELKPLLKAVTSELDKKGNRLMKRAETLRALPEAACILGASALLGWFLPWFNIQYTRKLYKSKNQQNNPASAALPRTDNIQNFRKYNNYDEFTRSLAVVKI